MSRALVLSGGGCKGAYAVGVAEVLMDPAQGNLTFDVVSGTSTGGLISPFIAAGHVEIAKQFYTSVNTPDILTWNSTSDLLKAGCTSLANYQPLIAKVKQVIAEIGYENIVGGPGATSDPAHMFMCGTRLEDINAVFFHNKGAPDGVDPNVCVSIQSEDDLLRAMVATASVPGIAPVVDLGGSKYVDGGVRENTPLHVPVAMGIEEIYVVLLSPPTSPPDDGPFDSLASVLGRTASAVTTDTGVHDLDAMPQAKALQTLFAGASKSIAAETDLTEEQVRGMLTAANPALGRLANTKFVVIQPDSSLAKSAMVFDKDEMTGMVQRGVEDAQKVLAAEKAAATA